MFSTEGNLSGDRVRIGRAIHKPPLTQEELERKLQLLGSELNKRMLSRIELGERHVCDIELRFLAIALDVTLDWLVGDCEDPKGNVKLPRTP